MKNKYDLELYKLAYNICSDNLKKYEKVLDEIREYIVNDIQHCTYGQVPKYQDILEILDKVKEL